MNFDPENHVVKLCTKGMELEGEKDTEAFSLFQQAWSEATNDLEKFIAAHYIARHQESVSEKLTWDLTSLELALKINDPEIKGTYPSLYLNVAKCYEELGEHEKALENYQWALSHTSALKNDGYGNMIITGIMNGMERVKAK